MALTGHTCERCEMPIFGHESFSLFGGKAQHGSAVVCAERLKNALDATCTCGHGRLDHSAFAPEACGACNCAAYVPIRYAASEICRLKEELERVKSGSNV